MTSSGLEVSWWWIVVAAVAACGAPPTYSNKLGGAAPAPARVVAAADAERSGLASDRLVIAFAGGRDGTELVMRFFQDADRRRAQLISELAIVIETTQGGSRVECHTAIVPESVAAPQPRAGLRTIAVQPPVQRMVTEQQYGCKSVLRPEARSYSAREERCGYVSRRVTHHRTVYSYQYDYSSRSTRSVPRTETYTTPGSRYECKYHPVNRIRTEMVAKTECGYDTVTRMATRYEFQFENTYAPPRMEAVTRQRLRASEPVCYAIEPAADDPMLAAPAPARGNRIEGRIFMKR